MSLGGDRLTANFWSTEKTPWSTYGGEACSQEKSSSSSTSSANDVDVHTAWDNYDLMLPVARRRSDDRCSLLTQWTESTASLKSCVSHNAVSRSLAESISTAAESDGGAYRHRAGTDRKQPRHRNRCRKHELDTISSSKRFVDSNASSRSSKNHSQKCGLVGPAVQQRHDYETRHRAVNQISSLWRRRHSSWFSSAIRRRHATARDVRHVPLTVNNDDDYITTSSESEDHPSTSASSFAPPNCVDDRASLLSCTTTSSSAVFTVSPSSGPCHQSLRQPSEPSLKRFSRHFFLSPRRRKSSGSSRSLTTSNDMDDDDNDLERSKSSEEIAVASQHPTEALASQSRQDELRAVKSLFEFRSSDELRIANDFIDGVWSLCSRRSLYNERYMYSKPTSLTSALPTSLFQLYYNRSEKDFRSDIGCNAGEIVANNDRKSNCSEVTGIEQHSLKTAQNNQHVANVYESNRGLKVADIVVRCDGVDGHDDWNGSQKEFRPLEMIAELIDVTATISNEDDLKVCIRKSPKTFNDISNDTQGRNTEAPDAEHRVPLPKLVKTACGMQLEHAAVSDAPSQRQSETVAVVEKSPGLSTLLSDWLGNGPGVKMLTEAVNGNSRFAAELIQVFDAVLVRSGVGERASVAADIMKFHPLTDKANGCTANEIPDALKLLRVNIDSDVTTLAKPTVGEFGSLANTAKSGKRANVSKNGCRKKRERESDIVWRLTPRLSVKPDLTSDLASTKSTDAMSSNANSEQSSPNQPACYDNGCMTATTSTQTNDDPQSTGETRMRISRKSRGRGKVRELIKLFESASASTLNNSASPIDVKRATISAAVSVGELLRRASEQEVTSRSQHVCALSDANAKQPKISSPKSTETLSSADVVQASHLFGDECVSKPEAPVIVHKSTARWPTMLGVRRKHARRHIYTTSVGDRAASRIDLDLLSKTPNSNSDARTAPANNDSKNLPRVDDIVGKTSEAVSLSSKEGAKLMNDGSSECQGASTIYSENSSLKLGRPEAHGCDVANVTSTANLSSPVVVSGLTTVVDSANSLSPATRQDNVCQLPSSPSSSASSQWPLKSLHTCEVAVTATTFTALPGGSGDIGSRHEEGGPASSDGIKQSAAHFTDEVHPSTNYIVNSRPMLLPPVGLPQEQSISTASPKSAVETTNTSKKTSSPEVATIDDCHRFNVQSWFIVGGPRLVEVPRWPLISGKDVVAIMNRSKSRARCPAKATLGTETSCPVVYPILRMTGVTVHVLNKDDVNNRHIGKGNETGSVEYTVDSYPTGERRHRTQPTKKQSRSYSVQAMKHKSSQTVTELTKGDEQLSEMSASCRPKNETVCSAETTKTPELDHEFDVNASSGQGDVKTLDDQKNHDRLKRNCKSVNPILSTNQRTTSDVTFASDFGPRPVDSRAPSDDPPSKRSSRGKQSDTTSLTRTSSITAKCGLVSGESIQSPGGVTVVCSRRRSTSDRPSAVTVTTPSRVSDGTQPRATDNYKRLAQQFLLTSLLEYRLDARRK